LGIGDWGLGPIPNPQSPIPNPQTPLNLLNRIYIYYIINKFLIILFINIINKIKKLIF